MEKKKRFVLKKFEVQKIELGGAEFSVYVDVRARELHILDLNHEGTRSVTNAVSQEWLIELENELEEVLGFPGAAYLENILYGTDGVAAHFIEKTASFAPVEPFRALYPPFEKVLRKRYADNFFGFNRKGSE